MSNYGTTGAVTVLAQKLILEGYDGVIVLTNNYPAGAKATLGECFSLQLSGFCKESLYVTADLVTGNIVFVGRYGVAGEYAKPTVEYLAGLAWGFYKTYKEQGYNRPTEWEKIWIKYGYLVPQKTTVLVEKK